MAFLNPCIAGERGNGFCGPAALVAVFGIDIDIATATIRSVTGKRSVFGVSMDALEDAMGRLGRVGVVEEVEHPDGLMRPWHGPLEKLTPCLDAGLYVIAFNNHYCALDAERGMVCDNHTIYPLALARYKFRRKRVVRIWSISQEQA